MNVAWIKKNAMLDNNLQNNIVLAINRLSPAPSNRKYLKRMPYESEELPTPHPVMDLHKGHVLDRNLPQIVPESAPQVLPAKYELKTQNQEDSPVISEISPLKRTAVVKGSELLPWSVGQRNNKKRKQAPVDPVPNKSEQTLEHRVATFEEKMRWEELERTAKNGVLRKVASQRGNDLLLPQFMSAESIVSPLFLTPSLKKLPPSTKIHLHP
eukprot:Gregarina_sp_Poly_1__1010@NODE_1246_length_4639_cov_204_610236_g849_i0_p2_GENE_NODE_1246_length_4639_cov_204_610236_g849_i0NODE_1246_length_4639_cov_204_610236_g849_i0_p2_ORF_typecomplete_len212_score27_82_NODE_1246_length_4639_cov_204_610236_g849_i030953730